MTKVPPPAFWIVLALALAGLQAHAQTAPQTPVMERMEYVVPFAKSGAVTVERSQRPVRPGQYTSEDLVPHGSAVSTGEDGAVSLMLGESAEAGTLRIGPGTEVRLPELVFGRSTAKGKGKAPPPSQGKGRQGKAVRSAADDDEEENPPPGQPGEAAKYSVQLKTGSVFLNAVAGRLTPSDSGYGHHWKWHEDAEVIVQTPNARVAAGVAQCFCTAGEGVETVGVMKGEVQLREPAATAGGLTVKEGQAVDFRDGRWSDARALTEEERTKAGDQLAQAMLKSVPLDVFVQGWQVREQQHPWQGWSREPKAPEVGWKEWMPLHSSFHFRSNDSQLSNDGVILTRLPIHEWNSIFRYQVHVREGEAAAGEGGVMTKPEVAPGRLKAVVFQMRIVNAGRLVYRTKEIYHTGEMSLDLNARAGEWRDYHLPLTDASGQGPNKRGEDRDGWGGPYMRFDPYQAKAKGPGEDIVFEMRDFRTLVVP